MPELPEQIRCLPSSLIAIHPAEIMNMLIKFDTFPLKCKKAKKYPFYSKGIKTEAKN